MIELFGILVIVFIWLCIWWICYEERNRPDR